MTANANNIPFGSLFFRQCVSVYALCAVLGLPATGQQSGKPGKGDETQDVKVTDYGTVDISVQDTDLATVLQMLSIESKKNIITSKAVSATVSANLYDVTFHEALQAILDVNGYTYYEEGNFIYVLTKQEADEIAKSRRATQSRIFPLNYLSAADANEFIVPLLSDVGKASARGTVLPGMKPEVSNNGADDYAFAPRLVINDYPENLDAMAALLSELDVPPQQVLVEAVVLQTELTEDNAFGVDFTVLGSLNFTDLTNPLSAVSNLLDGKNAKPNSVQPADNKAQAVTSTVGQTGSRGGLKVGVVSDDISVFLRVLDEVTDSTVLARPKVMALNRQRAEVHVGTKVGYLSTTSTETTTTQNVQFLDTGVQLIFRPFISTDGMIRLELKPSVSDFRLRDVTDSTGNSVTIPDELTNQVLTNVRVMDGQTLILGGLFKERFQTTRRQVPLLGDVPIVGAAFRGQDDTVQRSEIIFLITPTIVRDSTLWAMGADQLRDVDRLRVGARAQLLPFSREKVTANYNQKAQEALDRGDHAKALHYIHRSLNLAPNQPEIVELREEITGKQVRSHERSLMERAMRRGLGLQNADVSAEPQVMDSSDSGAMTKDAAAPANVGTTETPAPNSAETEAITGVTADHASATPAPAPGLQARPAQASAATNDPSPSSNPWGVEMTPEVEEWLKANSEEATSDESSTPTQSTGVTPEQWSFYQQLLFEYFTMINMPELASTFTCEWSDNPAHFTAHVVTVNDSRAGGSEN